jgi:hypothetical protein
MYDWLPGLILIYLCQDVFPPFFRLEIELCGDRKGASQSIVPKETSQHCKIVGANRFRGEPTYWASLVIDSK